MRPTAAALLAITLLAGSLRAQARPDFETGRTILTGTVVDPDGRPLAGAEVFLGTTDRPVTTGDQGRFRILDAPARSLWIAARRIGYAPSRQALTLRRGETREIRMVLEPLPVRLPDVELREQSGFRVARLADFWGRQRFGWGRFITRDQIEERNPAYLSQVVRPFLPFGALATWERSSFDDPLLFRSAAFSRTTGISRCAPAISIDGGMVLEGWMVDDFQVAEVEAIEVYRPRFSEIPAEFSYHGRARACGLVVLWTR